LARHVTLRLDTTRHVRRVETRRDEPSGVWAYRALIPNVGENYPNWPWGLSIWAMGCFFAIIVLTTTYFIADKESSFYTVCVQTMGVFRGGAVGAAAPPIENFFALFKYSLSSFLPNHMYSLCRIA